ncbi:unnamed protein product [Phytomonas sp. EM1]|nr:unnamed protein product [Phytomonas sp. EM1]|eukprot:CCW60808.1 unnamed protein product [Phytomonas sp. isolate EM1]
MPPKAQHDSDDELIEPMVANANMAKYFDLHYSEKFMKSLPEKIKDRVQVLLKYHDDYMELQERIEQQEQQLRKEFDAKYAPILERRREIINGMGSEVTDTEVMKGFPAEHTGKVDIAKEAGEGSKREGLPEFWLSALCNNVTLASMITARDEGALKHLIDVLSRTIDGGYGSFEVIFTFSPNDYFHEDQLTIAVVMGDKGLTVKRGPLTWKKGKNLTMEPAKVKHTKRNSRAQMKQVPCNSFFNIFQDKKDDDNNDNDDEDEDEEDVINVLRILHNNIIPCAVLHYTREADEGDGDMCVEEEDTDVDHDNSDTK